VKLKLVILILLVLLASNLCAFDGKRKGFLLGFGMGFANVSFNQEYSGYEGSFKSDTEKKTGMATDFKIGFAPNNKVELYYSSQIAWISIVNAYMEEVGITDGVGTFSLSYFLSPKLNKMEWAPSPYLSCGYGFSTWDAYEEEESDSWTGNGWFIGAGYEFSKHYRASINLFMNDPSISFYGESITTNSTAILFTLSAMAF